LEERPIIFKITDYNNVDSSHTVSKKKSINYWGVFGDLSNSKNFVLLIES